jgi:hypothetical protein
MSVVTVPGTYRTEGRVVSLEVVVGNGHAGQTDISHDGGVVASGGSRTSADGLTAGAVEVDTVVNQTAKQSMTLLVSYTFSGGPDGTVTFEGSHVVTTLGEGADFFGDFALT